MIFRNIIYLLVFFLLLNCNKKTLPEEEVLLAENYFEKNDLKLNKVFITGTTDDIPAFKVLNIINNTYLFGRPHLDFTKDIFSDSLHMVLNSIEKPLFSQIITASKVLYQGYAFLIPGDSISIRIKNGSMKFYGKNAILNNFYSEMSKLTPAYDKNPYLGNIKLYKKNVESIYIKKVAFFNQYIKDNTIQSDLFINTFKTHIKREYLAALVAPKNFKTGFNNLYIGDIDGLMPIIQKEVIKDSELIIDLSNYFGNISIEEFKNVNGLYNSVYFKNNINAYIRYYFLDSEYLAYSKEKFLAEKEFIQINFDSEIENYAIARMIRDYHLKGFGNSINSIELLKNTINEYEQRFTKPSYIEFMNDIKEDLKSYDFEISNSALNSKFINTTGDTLTLKNIFSRSKKRIKVVDFWASWCTPCLKQINEGKAFKDRLLVDNNVEWLYISPEKDYEKWVEANKKFEHVLNFNNSFFLLKGLKSSLARTFKVKEIPRYVILNKENKIVLNNAPSPSDHENFEKIIDRIYRKEKE
jgi:thiol-disulfide isomerase/thioredoxin